MHAVAYIVFGLLAFAWFIVFAAVAIATKKEAMLFTVVGIGLVIGVLKGCQ